MRHLHFITIFLGIVIIVILGYIISVISTVSFTSNSSKSFVLTTATSGGLYYPIGVNLCNFVNKDKNSPRCFANLSEGSLDNVRRLADGEADAAIIQSDIQLYSYTGTSPEGKDIPHLPNLRSIASLYETPVSLLVRTDSGINNVENLDGLKISAGRTGSGTYGTVDVLLDALGLSIETDVEYIDLHISEQSGALCDGKIDISAYTIGNPNDTIASALSECDSIEFLAIDGSRIDEFIENSAIYKKVIISKDIYDTSVDTPSFGVGATLVTLEETSDKVVSELRDALWWNRDTLGRLFPVYAGATEESLNSELLTAPLHSALVK